MKPRIPIALAVLLTASCASSPYYDLRYQPAPLEVEVAADSVKGSQVRALASVLGVARPNEETKRGTTVEMRLRLENLGTVDARVDAERFSLVSADLVAFDKVALAPNTDLVVPAGQTRTIDFSFGAPDKPLDWAGLNLRFTLVFVEARVTTGGTFSQIVLVPVDPVSWHVGFGYSTCW
jgi:hypothetical protein